MADNNDTALLDCALCGGSGRIGSPPDDYQECYECMRRPTAPQNAEALGACDHIEGANNCHISVRGYYCFDPIHLDKIRAALNQPRTVKPLVWNDDGVKGFAYATTPLFFYEISLNDAQTHYTLTCDSDWIGDFKTIEEAKAAAEAHYQAKIGECLG